MITMLEIYWKVTFFTVAMACADITCKYSMMTGVTTNKIS